MFDVFDPAWQETISVSNSASATVAVSLPTYASSILLTNTSSTARVHVAVTGYPDGIAGAGTAPTTSTGLPILPGGQIRVAVPRGTKVIRTIATAADGLILITPGRGG
jgi:hypothetical protein